MIQKQIFFKKIIFVSIILSLITASFVFGQERNNKPDKPEIEKPRELMREEKTNTIDEIMPAFEFIFPKQGAELSNEVILKGRVKNAQSIEFYYQTQSSLLVTYLGNGEKREGDFWQYVWDTNLTPNGRYDIFTKIKNQFGEYESQRIKIEIKNEIKRDEEKEKKLKEEIESAKEEIKNKEEEKKKIEVEKKKEIVENIQKGTEEIKNVLTEKEKEVIKKRVEEGLGKIDDKKLAETIKEFVEIIEKENKIEEKKRENEQKKSKIEPEIQSSQEKLIQIQERKEKLPEGQKKQEARIIEEIKQENLNSYQEEKRKIEENSISLDKELKEIKENKETRKKQLIETIDEVVKPVEELLNPEKKANLYNAKKEIKEKVSNSLENLEREIKSKEETKIKKTEILSRDSDNDGLSDEDEIRLKTDPFNPDTDNDGFLDGSEYLAGYDPLKPGPADKIIYQNPQNVLPKKAEIYQVEKIEKIILSPGQIGLKFRGKGLANSFVTLFIFSTPIIVAVKTDNNGNWEYTLDKPLTDGEHRVYATLTNNRGEIEARSETFVFVKSGEKIFRIFETPAEIASPVQSLQKPFIILILAIIVLALGITLILISILTKKKIEKI